MREQQQVAVVAGVGPGNGAALVRRFAEAGYAIAMLARSRDSLDPLEREIEDAHGYECDVTSPDRVTQTFSAVRAELGHVDVLLYNGGSGVFADVESITPEQFEGSWRVNAYGGRCSVRRR
ncbi:SDR family NAD(P)-dependent oxidoreductase [Microvirga pakistanensis]|uniref:SDR family NAD(P)-dependent oxidoreductase n=1 Tax=Microvirga pakistanensis TaxID=1682650 RepID=UPI00195DE780|nr:SDR family NAD(P)-dependent oxidoreductase [Microvirga pakistanensis]